MIHEEPEEYGADVPLRLPTGHRGQEVIDRVTAQNMVNMIDEMEEMTAQNTIPFLDKTEWHGVWIEVAQRIGAMVASYYMIDGRGAVTNDDRKAIRAEIYKVLGGSGVLKQEGQDEARVRINQIITRSEQYIQAKWSAVRKKT